MRACCELGKRRGRDSNSRYPKGYSGFRNQPDRPLRHLSRQLSLSITIYRLTRPNRCTPFPLHPGGGACWSRSAGRRKPQDEISSQNRITSRSRSVRHAGEWVNLSEPGGPPPGYVRARTTHDRSGRSIYPGSSETGPGTARLALELSVVISFLVRDLRRWRGPPFRLFDFSTFRLFPQFIVPSATADVATATLRLRRSAFFTGGGWRGWPDSHLPRAGHPCGE